ncbi:hypothetical protein GF380_03170 [Candidatus Uhrbacteria bacterium]|nr:hypothetical protein [Candidatus Uhrbacteria bacterium]MBD3284143.1 hypothetical protein [Candidatus Uhrbacteria bacterium]
MSYLFWLLIGWFTCGFAAAGFLIYLNVDMYGVRGVRHVLDLAFLMTLVILAGPVAILGMIAFVVIVRAVAEDVWNMLAPPEYRLASAESHTSSRRPPS